MIDSHNHCNIYANKAVSQIPRLLTCLDRNPYSSTYGCFHRDYWLYKTSDFPDAVRQFGVHALALVYKYDFPQNIYRGVEKMKEWTVAAMRFWTQIQHREGSFDELLSHLLGGFLVGAFDFRDKLTGHSVRDTKRLDFWSVFCRAFAVECKVKKPKVVKSITKVRAWLKRQVAPSLALLRGVLGCEYTSYMERLVKSGQDRLSPWHKRELAAYKIQS